MLFQFRFYPDMGISFIFICSCVTYGLLFYPPLKPLIPISEIVSLQIKISLEDNSFTQSVMKINKTLKY